MSILAFHIPMTRTGMFGRADRIQLEAFWPLASLDTRRSLRIVRHADQALPKVRTIRFVMEILAFSFHAGIWVHSRPEDLVLRTLSSLGHNVSALRCTGELDKRCVVIPAMGLNENCSSRERERACRKCVSTSTLLQNNSAVKTLVLSDWIKPRDHSIIQAYIEELTPYNWTQKALNGIHLARLSAYEIIINHKLSGSVIPTHLWPDFLEVIRSNGRILLAVRAVLSANHYDAAIAYNGLYSANRVALKVANRFKVNTYAIHAGNDLANRYSQLFIYDADSAPALSGFDEVWETLRNEHLSESGAQALTDHLLTLLNGSHRFVYSTAIGTSKATEIKSKLGIPPDRTVLLATLSSKDEAFAAEFVGLQFPTHSQVTFETIEDWLESIIQYASENSTVHLVIRVHPREFPNKREKVLAENVVRLREILSSRPKNVTVNWPDDDLSLYDLAQLVDVCLNFTSSAGLEMMMLGIPTVTPRTPRMVAYNPSISYGDVAQENFHSEITRAISDGWSIENAKLAFRWYEFYLNRLPIDISDGFTYPSEGRTPAVNHSQLNSYWAAKIRGIALALRNFTLKQLVLSLPPSLQFRQNRENVDLINGRRFEEVLLSGAKFSEPQPREQLGNEDFILATSLAPIVEKLETFWEPSGRNLKLLKHFVSKHSSAL